jgi:hypothetical protein
LGGRVDGHHVRAVGQMRRTGDYQVPLSAVQDAHLAAFRGDVKMMCAWVEGQHVRAFADPVGAGELPAPDVDAQ